MNGKSLIKNLLFALWLIGFAAPVSALTVYPGLPITEIVTVQPIVVSDDNGIDNTANFFGTTGQQTAIEGLIDTIWAQAGIDVNFLTPNSWNSTFANWGSGGPPNNGGNTRPTSDLGTIVADGASAGVTSANANVINIFFVNIAAGFDLLTDNAAAGLAYVNGNGISQYVGSNLLGWSGGQEVVASVVAHEIGHNLGLTHLSEFENLMQPGGSGERLNDTQIATALASEFSVAVVPIPAAVWLFGSGLLGLIGYTKRKKAA